MTEPIAELWRVKRLLAEAQDIERTGPGRGLRSLSFRLATQKLAAVLGEAPGPVEPAPVHDAIDAAALLIRLEKIAEALKASTDARYSIAIARAFTEAHNGILDLIAAATKARAAQDAAESGARRFEALFEGKPNWQGMAAAGDEPGDGF